MSSPAIEPIGGSSSPRQGRTALACLLHALNQPLTGLQCSLELAAACPRPREEYARTLRDALELTTRMRVLVEALREIADMQSAKPHVPRTFFLHQPLSETVQDLQPIADALRVPLELQDRRDLVIAGEPWLIKRVFFHLLDSALSLAQPGTGLQIVAAHESSNAMLRVAWVPGPAPEFSPFSRQELGLLIAQTGWEHSGGTWTEINTEQRHRYELRMPLSNPQSCIERTTSVQK